MKCCRFCHLKPLALVEKPQLNPDLFEEWECLNCWSLYVYELNTSTLASYLLPITTEGYYGVAYIEADTFVVNKVKDNGDGTCTQIADRIVMLHPIPQNINPLNFQEKLKTLLTFS